MKKETHIAGKTLARGLWDTDVPVREQLNKFLAANPTKSLNAEARKVTKEAAAKRWPVIIYNNDEAGRWQHSVVLINTSYWLDSFPTYAKAVCFCKRNNLNLEEP